MPAEPHEALDTALGYIDPLRDALLLARRTARPDETHVYDEALNHLDLQENWLLSGLVRSFDMDDAFGDSTITEDDARYRLAQSDARRREVT